MALISYSFQFVRPRGCLRRSLGFRWSGSPQNKEGRMVRPCSAQCLVVLSTLATRRGIGGSIKVGKSLKRAFAKRLNAWKVLSSTVQPVTQGGTYVYAIRYVSKPRFGSQHGRCSQLDLGCLCAAQQKTAFDRLFAPRKRYLSAIHRRPGRDAGSNDGPHRTG